MKTPTHSQRQDIPVAHMSCIERDRNYSSCDEMEHSIESMEAACPLTGSTNTTLLETLPTSLLIDCYQRDLGLDVTSEFVGVKSLQLWRCLDSDLMFFHPMITGSSEFYRNLHDFSWYFPETKFEHDYAAAWIKPDARILDIGCGAAQFVQKFPQATYTGLDPNYVHEKEVTRTNTHILTETIEEHAMTHVHDYDVVCAFQVLEHVANPREFLTAALACLKPEGLLILGVPSAESYVSQISNFVLNAPPHHVTWWTDQSLHALAQKFQLSVIVVTHAPVESWETRLYWMQRLANMCLHKRGTHFTTLLSQRLCNIAAYLGAGCISPFASLPTSAQGSTVVMVARKNSGVLC